MATLHGGDKATVDVVKGGEGNYPHDGGDLRNFVPTIQSKYKSWRLTHTPDRLF
jgi:hypothetical protein